MSEVEETRYAKQTRTNLAKARHAAIASRLAAGPIEAFEQAADAMEKPLPCVAGGIPSKWADWDSDPEKREEYETDMPTRMQAKALCATCPLGSIAPGGKGLCKPWAMATGQSHGVYDGQRRENNKWIP